MNYKNLITTSLILLLTFSVLSCDDDDNGPAANKRNVKIEVTGTFSGTMDATFITESGGGTNESITLPWTKEINYAASVPSMSILAGGFDGVPGQTISVKVFAGGELVSSTPGTADANGIVAVSSPTYIF